MYHPNIIRWREKKWWIASKVLLPSDVGCLGGGEEAQVGVCGERNVVGGRGAAWWCLNRCIGCVSCT